MPGRNDAWPTPETHRVATSALRLGGMTDSLDDYAALLRDRIDEARAQRAALLADVDAMREARSLTLADDEHDPEGSTVSLDQARDTALLEQVEQTLGELLAAKERLAAGTYGVCARCHQPIPAGRLQVRPEARLCVHCTDRRKRPITP